jgi:hypothetical protein
LGNKKKEELWHDDEKRSLVEEKIERITKKCKRIPAEST